MKFVVIFATCLIVFVSAGEETTSKRAAIIEKCKKDLSLSDDVASIANVKKEAETEQQKCFLQCVYENMGLIKDGKLNAEGADAVSRSKFNDDTKKLELARAIFDKCQKEYVLSNDKCHLGAYIRKCLVQNDSSQLRFFSN